MNVEREIIVSALYTLLHWFLIYACPTVLAPDRYYGTSKRVHTLGHAAHRNIWRRSEAPVFQTCATDLHGPPSNLQRHTCRIIWYANDLYVLVWTVSNRLTVTGLTSPATRGNLNDISAQNCFFRRVICSFPLSFYLMSLSPAVRDLC